MQKHSHFALCVSCFLTRSVPFCKAQIHFIDDSLSNGKRLSRGAHPQVSFFQRWWYSFFISEWLYFYHSICTLLLIYLLFILKWYSQARQIFGESWNKSWKLIFSGEKSCRIVWFAESPHKICDFCSFLWYKQEFFYNMEVMSYFKRKHRQSISHCMCCYIEVNLSFDWSMLQWLRLNWL